MCIEFRATFDKSQIPLKVSYILSEHSFLSEPCLGDYSVLIDKTYVLLDVSSIENIVCGFSGYSPEENWISRKLDFPKAKSGQLYVLYDDVLPKGTAITYNRDWLTFFDSSSGIVCLGNPILNSQMETVEFCTDMVAALVGNKLVSIWIKPRFIQAYDS